MKVLEATKTMIDNKNQNEYYETLDFFMLRAPLLPINLYQSIFDLEYDHYDAEKEKVIARLANLAENPLIRESISVASLSLLESLPNLMNEQDKKKRDQVLKGFIRYLIRMMSRPTPYGLCSGVAYGKIQEDIKLTLSDVSEYYKRSRPDKVLISRKMESARNDCIYLRLIDIKNFIKNRMSKYLDRKLGDRMFFQSSLIQYMIWEENIKRR